MSRMNSPHGMSTPNGMSPPWYTPPRPPVRGALFFCLSLLVLGTLVWSGFATEDHMTWAMEVAPAVIAGPVLLATGRRFPLTTLLYLLITVHLIGLIVGGTYGYARVPIGYWLQDLFDLSRNPYDRIGHFMQGLVPALLAREILLQRGYLTHRYMAGFLSLCVAMAISAVYELVEWAVALRLGAAADDFLGLQGDKWDAQADMFMALLGSLVGLMLLSRWQDRQRARLPGAAN
jgi:putative membrane protein